MRQFLPDLRRPAEYARAGWQSVRGTLRRQPLVRQLETGMERILRGVDRTVKANVPGAANTLRWVRESLNPELAPGWFDPPLNASGIILPADQTVAWSDAAIQQFGVVASRGYSTSPSDRQAAAALVASLLQQIVPCDNVTITRDVAAAVNIGLNLSDSEHGRWAMPKRHAVQFAGLDLANIANRAGNVVTEVGSVDEINFDRLLQVAVQPEFAGAALVLGQNVPANQCDHLNAVAALSHTLRSHGKRLAIFAQHALPVSLGAGPAAQVPTLAKIGNVADVLVFSGGGLLGGPPCTVVASCRPGQSLRQRAWHSADLADVPTLAAFAETLRLWTEEALRPQLPIWQLLTVTPEAVGSRTERLRQKLSGAVAGVTLEVVGSTVTLTDSPFQTASAEFPALAIGCPDQATAARLAPLSISQPRILAASGTDSATVTVQLASLLPRDDERLGEILQSL